MNKIAAHEAAVDDARRREAGGGKCCVARSGSLGPTHDPCLSFCLRAVFIPPPSCVPQGPGVEERQVVVVGVGHQEEGPGEGNRHPPTMALVAGVVEGHLRHKKMAEAVVHLLVLLHPPSHGSARSCTGAR